MRLPKKNYLTFDELIVELNCSNAELFHLIATRKLIPSAILSGSYPQWQEIPEQYGFSGIPSEIGVLSLQTEMLHGTYYLLLMDVLRNDICTFKFFSTERNPEKFRCTYGLDNDLEIKIDRKSGIVQVPEYIIFMREEIDRFERENTQSTIEEDQSQSQTGYSLGQIKSLREQLGEAQKRIDDLRRITGDLSAVAPHNVHLMRIAIQVQSDYWADLNAQPKQETLVAELIKKYGLTKAEAQAVERVACPINRRKNVSPRG